MKLYSKKLIALSLALPLLAVGCKKLAPNEGISASNVAGYSKGDGISVGGRDATATGDNSSCHAGEIQVQYNSDHTKACVKASDTTLTSIENGRFVFAPSAGRRRIVYTHTHDGVTNRMVGTLNTLYPDHTIAINLDINKPIPAGEVYNSTVSALNLGLGSPPGSNGKPSCIKAGDNTICPHDYADKNNKLLTVTIPGVGSIAAKVSEVFDNGLVRMDIENGTSSGSYVRSLNEIDADFNFNCSNSADSSACTNIQFVDAP